MLDSNSRKYKKNYIFLLAEGILFDVGIIFFSPSTIIPLLMSRLTGSSVLVGMLGMVRYLSAGLSSIIAGNKTRSFPFKKKSLIFFGSYGRLPLWILGLCLVFYNSNHVFFWGILILAIQMLFWSADGSIFTVWSDVLGKSILENKRGRFFSYRQIISGVLAIIASGAIKTILSLEYFSFPVNYGVVIIIGAIIFTFSVLMFAGIEEKASSVAKPVNFKKLIMNIPYYFKTSKAFSISMLTLFWCSMSTIALPFYVIYSQSHFGLNDSDVGIFITVQVIGRMLGGVFYGYIGDKLGHEKSILIYAISAFMTPFIIIVISFSNFNFALIFFSAAYFFIGIFMGGWFVFLNYMIDLVRDKQRTLFASLINLVRIPTSIAPFLGGIIVRQWGYIPVFFTALIFAISGIIFAVILPPAQRTKENPIEKGVLDKK